jgi:DNA invertase Pin-like site-specific DNA recombinase
MQQVIEESEEPEAKARITREEIETFIRDNLTTSSLKTIVANFNTNTSMVYRVLELEKPGDLIQKVRHQKVKSLRSEGKTAREIAGLTGLSETYVWKIWKS